MTTVPNRPEPGDPYYGLKDDDQALLDEIMRERLTRVTAEIGRMQADRARLEAWLTDHRVEPDADARTVPAAAAAAGTPMTREALLLHLAAAVKTGAPAPMTVGFVSSSHGPELELVLPDNDRAGVTLYAGLLGLPLPREFRMATYRGGRYMRVFGASSVRVDPAGDRDPGEPAGPRLFHGWVVAVHCYVDAGLQPAAAVGVAPVAPQHAEVPW